MKSLPGPGDAGGYRDVLYIRYRSLAYRGHGFLAYRAVASRTVLSCTYATVALHTVACPEPAETKRDGLSAEATDPPPGIGGTRKTKD